MKFLRQYGAFSIFLCASSMILQGQDVQLYGTIPSVLFKNEINDRLSFSFNISSEVNAVSRTVAGRDFPAQMMNFNFEPAFSYDKGPNLSLAGAFLLRLDDPGSGIATELRPWQQITTIHRIEQYRIRNRLRVEERWRESDNGARPDFDLRIRYRLSADFPLQGQQLDNKEFYLNASTEALITPTSERAFYFWESRTVLGVGYRFSDRQRLEPALDFRSRRRNDKGDRRNFLFFRLVWVVKVGS